MACAKFCRDIGVKMDLKNVIVFIKFVQKIIGEMSTLNQNGRLLWGGEIVLMPHESGYI